MMKGARISEESESRQDVTIWEKGQPDGGQEQPMPLVLGDSVAEQEEPTKPG
jgi:ribosome assembly protein YihI (activator of Der GTPase)